MPEFRGPDTPDTPRFLADLESELRTATSRLKPRPVPNPSWTPDWITVQRILMPVGMTAMAFVVAAAMVLPNLSFGPAETAATPPVANVPAAAPATVTDAPEPTVTEFLVDGRFSLAEFDRPTRTADMAGPDRSFVR